jgi:5'-3' exonuclease
MGVPFFFGELRRRYPDIVIHDVQLAFDWLMTDTNGLIHPICRKVMDENPKIKERKELEWLMACSIMDELKKLLEITDASNMFIAIDGPPPMAKIKQQRSRRFKSASDRRLENKVRTKWGLKPIEQVWDTAAITPGTGFMRRLAFLINHRIAKGWFGKNKKIEFSSSDEPGEGEHKIKDKIRELYLRAKKKDITPPKIAVHGLDADLIFLCMSCGCPKLYLMRESEQIYGKDKTGDKSIVYVDIDLVSNYAIGMMTQLPDMKPLDIIRDWIALCYFLGNDFLPHFPSLSVKSNGLQQLMSAYGIIGKQFVVRDRNTKIWDLDIDTLKSLVAVLATTEVNSIRYYSKNQHRYNNHPRSFEDEWQMIQRLQPPPKDTVMVGCGDADKWKCRYYTQYMQTDSFARVYEISKEYYRGLVWVTNYYFGKCIDWNWFYQGDYAPFLSDFANANLETIEFEDIGEPISPGKQLLLCLPIFSEQLIPSRYRSLVQEDGVLHDLYPSKCDEDLLWKMNLWQGIPRLPAFDPERVLAEARKIDAKKLKN